MVLMVESTVANKDATLIEEETPAVEPPALKGYLLKYTNVARGYHTRWLVLKDGILSCMSHPPHLLLTS